MLRINNQLHIESKIIEVQGNLTDNLDNITEPYKIYKDIEFLVSKNIKVVPLSKLMGNIRDVKIGSNSKLDFKPTLKINKPLFNIEILNQSIQNNIVGFYQETGKRSNILIVDIDLYKIADKVRVLKQSLNPCLVEQILGINTLTIKTPNGYHKIFKYTDKIKNRTGIFGNIDIRTDEGICYFGIRDDGDYSITNYADIIELDDGILNELINYKHYKDNLNQHIIKIADIDDNNLSNIVDIEKGFNISEKDLYIILLNLPSNYLDDYIDWLEITYILKKYNYCKVWNLWSKHSKYYNRRNNISIFNSLNTDKEFRDINYIIYILNKTNKYKFMKLNNINKIYRKYEPLSNNSKALITDIIDVKFLNHTLYKSGKDTIVKSGLGTSKSTSVKNYVKDNFCKCLIIAPLQETVNNLYHSFKKDGLDSIYYKDLDIEKQLNKINEFRNKEGRNNLSYDDAKQKINIDIKNSSVFITIDSILILSQYDINYSEYVVFLDEIHYLIKYIITCENLKDRRKQLFSYFMNILKHAKQIIMADGDICNNCIKLLQKLNRGSFEFVINEYQPNKGIRCFRINDYYRLIEKMKDDFNNKLFFTCCCNTKESANKLYQLLKDFIPKEDLLLYTADEGDRIININKEWSNKYIIYSPTIVCGLDFNPIVKYNTYSIIEGDSTLSPEEIGQQIARNRNINELFIYINKISNNCKYNCLNDVKDATIRGINAFKEAFKDLVDTSTSDDGTKIDYKDNIFTELLYELEYQQDTLKSSYYYNLFEILKNKGFEVETNLYKNISLEKSEQNRLKVDIKNNIDDLMDKYINNELSLDNRFRSKMNKTLKDLDIDVDDEKELLKYSDLITDEKNINQHLNIRLLTLKDDILNLLNKAEFDNEYLEIFYKDKKPIILILREIFDEYLKGDINIFNYNYNYDDDFLGDEIKIKDYHYQYIKSIVRTNKSIPFTKGALLELLNLVMKQLLGRDMIKSSAKNCFINNRQIKKYNYSFNNELFEKHLELYNLSLKNNNKYKYLNLEDDIRTKYFKDVEITDDNILKYNEDLLNHKKQIQDIHIKNIKDQLRINNKFNKINKK